MWWSLGFQPEVKKKQEICGLKDRRERPYRTHRYAESHGIYNALSGHFPKFLRISGLEIVEIPVQHLHTSKSWVPRRFQWYWHNILY